MKKKTFNLVVGITGGVATILSPAYAVQIVAGIGIASTAVTEICSLFVKTEK